MGNSLFITTRGDSLFLSTMGKSLLLGASMGVSKVFEFVATSGNTTMGLDNSFVATKGSATKGKSLLASFDVVKHTVVRSYSTDKVGASAISPFCNASKNWESPMSRISSTVSGCQFVTVIAFDGCKQVRLVP